MQKSFIIRFSIIAALISVSFFNCKKISGIDNGNIIETPYSLYFSDSSGALYKSNDGTSFNRVFSPDGFPARALMTCGDYVLWCKENIYISADNGDNFSHAFDSLQSLTGFPSVFQYDVNGRHMDLNQSMLAYCPGSPGFVYATTNSPHSIAMPDYVGVAYNNNYGKQGNWSIDNGYDTIPGNVGSMPVRMVSFALMPNGTLAGLAIADDPVLPDYTSFRNFYNNGPTNPYSFWEETTGSLVNANLPTAGVTLPPNAINPDTGFFTLGAYNSRLIAIDQKGNCGAWYSDDLGRNWAPYSGLPKNTPLLCINSPFNQICFIGTYRQGLYYLSPNTTTWMQVTSGLTSNLIIWGITYKQNIFKNNTKINYVFLATNMGIYKSVDNGLHWVLTIPGNFRNIY